MRRILVLLAFLSALGLSAAPVINVSPSVPKAQQAATFSVSGLPGAATLTNWYFGDDSIVPGTNPASHTYAEPGRYRVRAVYWFDGTHTLEKWITVDPAYQKGPSAPFNLTSVILRWNDGRSFTTVPKDSEGLTAYADIKFEGTGPFQAQWLVDGQVLKTVSQTLSFAGRATLDSGVLPALYTNILGPHDVTLRILSPTTNFRIPVIRYEVGPTAPSSIPPTIESVYPPAVHQGDEVELLLTGRNFTADMKPDFGPGITRVGPVTLTSPMSAKVKVFVPPTTKPGFRPLTLLKGKERLMSSARLEVLGGAKTQVMSGSLPPCPDQETFEKGSISQQQPSWRDTGAEFHGEHVPTLTDFTLFGWEEKTPGAAEYFELRVYDKTGTNLILTQKLPGGTSKWNTSPDFVPKLMNLVKGGGARVANLKPASPSPGKLAASVSRGALKKTNLLPGAAPSQAQQQAQKAAEEKAKEMAHLAEISDALWQIVGLREYTCLPRKDSSEPLLLSAKDTLAPSASLPGGPKIPAPGSKPLEVQATQRAGLPVEEAPKPTKITLEVSTSDLWPVKLPEQAKGITPGTCQSASPGTTLSAVKISGDMKDGDIYPGDGIQLSGNFTLANSPYGFIAQDVKSTPPPAGSFSGLGTPYACKLDNVFVDWGDGKGIEPLSVDIPSSFSGNSVNSGTPFIIPAKRYIRTYEREGVYNVRVFMLSEDDVQLAGLKSASGAMAYKGETDSNFLSLVKTAAGMSDGLKSLPAGNASSSQGFTRIGGMQLSNTAIAASLQAVSEPSLQSVLSRAYLIFCDTKRVRPFKDHCALKPLELVSVELSFDGPSKAGTMTKVAPSAGRLAKPAGKPGAPALSQTATLKPPPSMSVVGSPAPHKPINELKADMVTNACNEAFTARTVVKFHGHGTVKVTWKVDGEVVCESKPTEATTQERTGLTKAQAEEKDCSKVPPTELVINMTDYLPVSTPGFHILTAEARVVPDARKVHVDRLAADLVSLGKGGRTSVSPETLAALSAATGAANPGKAVRFGVLNPAPSPGMPHMVYMSDVAPTLTQATGLQLTEGSKGVHAIYPKQPPYFVESGRKVYKVEAVDPKEPCSIDFPTKNGPFRVTDLAKNVKTEVVGGVTRMTGAGKLKVAIRASEDTVDERLAVPVTLSQWEVDGAVVTKGEVNLTGLGSAINLPGTKGTLDALKGKVAGKGKTEDMLAKLTLAPADATLTLTGTGNKAPSWSVEKPLSSEGDFYAEGLDLPETFVGRTPWVMKSQGGVVLDYSHKEGTGPAGQGNSWVGVRLKKLAFIPFSFQLVTQSPAFPLVDTWYLGDGGGNGGLHGTVDFQNWEGKFQDGSIKVGTMHFEALGGQNYKANYRNTEVQVPWFATPIKGDIAMTKSGDGYIWNYETVKTASMPAVVNGGFSLKPANLYFTSEPNIAWTVMGDAILDFKADGRPFASFTLDRFCYRFDGRASFEKDTRSRTVVLNKKSTLGDTQADIKSVNVTMPAAGQSVVNFDFNTSLRLSDSPILPAADVVVGYRLNKTGAAYSAPPAATAPFELAMAFPMGSPSVNGKIHPVYAPSSGGGASTRYTGSVDLGMFGGPPFKTQFVLGYQGNKDYFLCRADIPLGPSGVVLYPELLTLYKIHGGLGYNFGVDAFKDNVSILNAQPDMKGNALFSAGMRVGSADSFAYMLDGTLTISTAGAARMDYDAWLLTTDHGGQGQFKGWFQYANSSFDGKLWGGLDMLGGLVQFSMGNSEANAAVDMHLASDSWHIYAGQKNGQRIKAKVITSESDSYMMLGSQEGLAIGGAQNYYLGIGSSSVASAYAKAYLDMGLQVTPQPKIIGDFGAGMSAGVCVFGVCVSGGVNAAVHAEALPLDVRASCNLDLPWPLDDVDFTVHM